MSDLLKTASDGTSAPLSNASTTGQRPYDLKLHFYCSPGDKDYSLAKQMDSLLSSHLMGIEACDLYALDMTYQTTAAGQTIAAIIQSTHSGITTEMISMLPESVTHTSTSYNYGVKVTERMVVPDLFSRQIKPSDSRAMPFKFYLKASKEIKLGLTFYIKVHGPVSMFSALLLN